MIVLEPRVTEEKLRELLALGTESPQLDFKEDCDLDETRDRVELAKDIGAMQVDGGFIVIGADSHGRLTGRLTRQRADRFDEARVRQVLGRWIPAPLDLLVGVHELDGSPMVLIFVGPSSKGMCIFKADGQYPDPSRGSVSVFRQGDVFVRDGTQSRRWQQPDIDRIIDNIRNREKERWRAELTEDLKGILEGSQTIQTFATAPASALSWRIDEQTFEGVIVEQVRRDDLVPLRLLLERLPAELSSLLTHGREDDAETLLDRLVCIAAIALRLDRDDVLELVVATYVSLYELTFDQHGIDRNVPGPWSSARLRLEIIRRVMAVGAYAVRRRDWRVIPLLVLQRPRGRHLDDGLYTNWIRHTSTMAARADLLYQIDEQGNRRESGLLSFVLATASATKCLHQDLPEEGIAENDRLIDSVVQFDFLAAVTVLGRAPGDRDAPYYPSFAPFYWHRFEPVLRLLIEDEAVRSVFSPVTNEQFRRDVRDLLALARREGFRFGGGGPLSDPVVLRFVEGDD